MSTSLNECFTVWVLHLMNTSLNEYFTEYVLHWMSTSLNEYFTESVLHWMSTSMNELFTEWVTHWKNTALIGNLMFPLRLWSCNMQHFETKKKTLKSFVARILWSFYNNYTIYLYTSKKNSINYHLWRRFYESWNLNWLKCF